jgi:molecular chaperone GrpE (heat shock protein)
MNTNYKKLSRTMLNGLKQVGLTIAYEMGFASGNRTSPAVENEAAGGEPVTDPETKPKPRDIPCETQKAVVAPPSHVEPSVVQNVPAPVSPAPPTEEIRDPEFLTRILESQESMSSAMEAQFRGLGAVQESVAKQIGKIEATYKDALAENQVSIRRLTDTVRTLEDRAFHENVLKPLLRELVSLTDSLGDIHRILAANKNAVPPEAVLLSEAVEASLTDILARQGVTRMPDQVLALDLRRQKIIRIERSPILKDGEVISVERGGYEWDGQVLRPQEVTVRKVG